MSKKKKKKKQEDNINIGEDFVTILDIKNGYDKLGVEVAYYCNALSMIHDKVPDENEIVRSATIGSYELILKLYSMIGKISDEIIETMSDKIMDNLKED